MKPPERAERLLARALPGGAHRDSILGDLQEEFEERVAAAGLLRRLAPAWYWLQAIGIWWRLAPGWRRLASHEIPGTAEPLKGPEPMTDALVRDLQTAVRSLVRSPGFTAVVVLTLALGIGVNTLVFSVMRTVLFEPLPYRAPEELVALWTTIPEEDVLRSRSSWANVRDWRAQSRALAQVAVHDPSAITLGGEGAPERVAAVAASPDFFPLLGVAPALGRTYTAEEAERQERVVVLSHALWQQRYGADPGIVGEQIEINGAGHRVIGVMPPGFGFLERRPALWLPHTLPGDWQEEKNERGTGEWQVVARVSPGASVEDARLELRAVAERLEQAHPESNRGLGARVVPLREQLTDRQARVALWALWGAVGFVLLIACVNVANLLLARGAARRREMALRSALGAGRARLVRLLLVESVLVSGLGGLLGAAVAVSGLELLPWLGAAGIPRLGEVSVDGVVLGFAVALGLLTGLAFGMVPALAAARPDLTTILDEDGRSSRGAASLKVRRALAVAQLALAMVTLTGAGLLGRSLMQVLDVDLGFDARDVLYARLTLPGGRSERERLGFYKEVLERIEGVDGVESAGAIDDLFRSNVPDGRITIEGAAAAPAETRQFTVDDVTRGFFEAMRVPLLSGRTFDGGDRPGSRPVALVNETMARRYFPDADPIGRRLQLGEVRPDGEWLTVVGVVGDFRRSGPEVGTRPQLFRAFAQRPSRSMTLLIRSASGDPSGVFAALRAEVATVDRTAPVFAMSTLEEELGGYFARRSFQARLLGIFAGAALLLAAIGTYGLMAQSVQQRTGEIGARMALGATREDILRLVLAEGLVVAAIGLAGGLAGGLLVVRMLRNLLFGVAPTDPLTLIAVCLVLFAATLLRCSFPALRAARLDPASVLRGD